MREVKDVGKGQDSISEAVAGWHCNLWMCVCVCVCVCTCVCMHCTIVMMISGLFFTTLLLLCIIADRSEAEQGLVIAW